MVLGIRDAFSLSVLLIEHDMSMVMSISDRIYVVEYGCGIANGSPEAVRNNPQALWDVDLRIEQGEIVTLVGANGAGKTTILMAICGIVPLTKGEILLDKAPIHKAKPDRIVRLGISQALQATGPVPSLRLCGWVRTRRDAKDLTFIEINDGSCLGNIQLIAEAGCPAFPLDPAINTGASVQVIGELVASPAKGQLWEVKIQAISLLGEADPATFPLQKKRHSDEFLRTIAHLRPRTNKFGAMFRIRSEAAFAVHEYFREQGFYHVHTPILTGSDCEGAGEMFRVTTLPIDHTCPREQPGQDNLHAADFFGRECNLTVSGQLEAENMALALGKVYAFGPTFRAENSNTPRHCAEFWMIEPEIAFADLTDNMNLAEDLTQTVVRRVMERCAQDLELFNNFVDTTLFERLNTLPKNAWDIYSSARDTAAMGALAERYRTFLSQCKTERETIAYAKKRLQDAGFREGFNNPMAMVTLHGKTLFAVRRGSAPLEQGLRLLCAHADSPRLDLKQHPLQEQSHVGQAKTHYYGGIRKYQWLARPLALHGVVVREGGEVIPVVLGEDPAEPVFTIADLLPHLAAHQAEQPLSKAFEGEKLNLILGHQPLPKGKKTAADKEPKELVKAHILALLHKKYGIVEEDLYSAELQAVPAGPARYVGLDAALIGGYGQDDRINIFTALEAMLAGTARPYHTQCLMFWDKEEIGSEGSTGAKSRFFEYCVQDCLAAWAPRTAFSKLMLNTMAISADVHAAVDPDWQELHEKLNAAYLGHGPCFCKFTGHRGKYEANDAHPEYVSWLRRVLNAKKIPWQMAELGKVDGGGGGTVAMHLASYGMHIIDCGPPILSMHSPFEVASKVDLYATTLAFTAFLQESSQGPGAF
ncbi:hypothetical protein B566_EDAN018830 [Ephemera danica]|nr:hypothetical protein B566_EDAN018830 [Ephemera danica]